MPLSLKSLITMSLKVRRLSTHSISPHSSFSGVTAYVLISATAITRSEDNGTQRIWQTFEYLHIRRLLDSTSFLKSRLIMLLNSMSRWSLRRSSLGLHRMLYTFPSEPRIPILRGFWREFKTCTSSSMAINSQWGFCRSQIKKRYLQ